MGVAIDLAVLTIGGVVLGITFVVTIGSLEDDKSKIIVYPLALFFGAISSYLVLKSTISLFWRLVHNLFIIKILLAKIALFILYDPLASTVFVGVVLTALWILEHETSLVHTALSTIHYHYDQRLAVKMGRIRYAVFRNRVKNGMATEFEGEAKRVIE